MCGSMQQGLSSFALAQKSRGATPLAVVNLSLHGTLLLNAALGEHMASTGLRSAVLAVASFATGLGPDAHAAQVALKVLLEVATEAVFIYHQQASLPFVAIVHALRQAIWMCISVWALNGDSRQSLQLGACNWTFLVLVSFLFQRYAWTAYQRRGSTQQRQSRLPPLSTVLEGVPGFVTETPNASESLLRGASNSLMVNSDTIPYISQQSGWDSEVTMTGTELDMDASAPGTPTLTSIGDLLGHYGNTKQGKEWAVAMQRFSDDGSISDAKHSADSLYAQAYGRCQLPPPMRQPSDASNSTGARHHGKEQSQGASTVTATSSNRSSSDAGARLDAQMQQKLTEMPVEMPLVAADPSMDPPAVQLIPSPAVIQSVTPIVSVDSDYMAPAAAAAERAVEGLATAERDAPLEQQLEAMAVAVGSAAGAELPAGQPPSSFRDASRQEPVTEPAQFLALTDTPAAVAVRDLPTQQQAADADVSLVTARDGLAQRRTASDGLVQWQMAQAGGDAAINAALRRLPSAPHQLEALIRSIDEQRRRPYKRKTDRETKAVHVKVKGIELEQLPPDLSGMLHGQLRQSMPGVMMASMALRSGCVIIALDLLSSPEDGQAAGGAGMADLMSRIMQGHPMGNALENGATLSIQTPDEITLCQWNTFTSGYLVVDNAEGTLDPSALQSHHMISTLPAVLCLPEAADCTDSAHAYHDLTLTVELQLPSNCHLYGWQPTGVAAAAGSDVQAQAAGVVDAMLLARRLDGGYLPVVVEGVVRVDMDGADSAQRITAQVVVTVDGIAPAALVLELWCQGQGTGAPTPQGGRMEPGLELLVSHMPLLVLPSSWKEAAEELQQHIEETGGVQPRNALPPHARDVSKQQTGSEGQGGCLLEDLGMWLTHHHRSAGRALPDSLMSQLGDDLLVYAVQHGLGAVAGVIVDVMPRVEKQGTGDNPSPWLRRVSGSGDGDGDDDGDRMNLLHAAMVSGNADVLGQLFRWGALYGGPGWSWSWELEASEGLTALHFTASQPEDICRGMLETITRMLPAAQVHAARNAWLHCQGGVSTTPAQLSGMAAHGNGEGVNFMWASDPTSSAFGSKPSAEPRDKDGSAAGPGTKNNNRAGKVRRKRTGSGARKALDVTSDALAGKPAAQPHTNDGSAAGPSNSEGSSSGGSEEFSLVDPAAVDAAGLTASTAASSTQPRAKVQSWLGSVVEVWGTPETEEYILWASNQASSWLQTFQIMHWWVVPLLFLALLGMYRSASEGCVQYELMHLCLHGLAYIPIVASARTLSWLGNWQVGGDWVRSRLRRRVRDSTTAGVQAQLPRVRRNSWLRNKVGGNSWLGHWQAQARLPHTQGISWLRHWQAWMLVTHTLDAVGYGVKTCLSIHQATVWVAMSSSLVNACCVVLISAALDQAPKPQLLVACMFVVYLRSLAYQMVGHPHPLRHAVVTDAIALCISTLARARQLRAFQAWLAELLHRRQGVRVAQETAPVGDKPDRDVAINREEIITGRQELTTSC